MITPKNIHKIWFSVGGDALELLANPRLCKLDLEKKTFEAILPKSSAEAEGLMSGNKFLYERNVEIFLSLEAKPTTTECQSRATSGLRGYELKAQIAEETEAIAWYEIGEGMQAEAIAIQIVNESGINSARQIWIGDNGKIKVSPDLVGKTINLQVPAVLPTRVVILPEPIDNFQTHFIVEIEGGDFYYLECNCAIKNPGKQNMVCDIVLTREELCA